MEALSLYLLRLPFSYLMLIRFLPFVIALFCLPAIAVELKDIPLPKGFSIIDDQSSVYDTEAGRFVDVFARGQVEVDLVHQFYARTLPSLGWSAVTQHIFTREGEKLNITIEAGGEHSFIHIWIHPR